MADAGVLLRRYEPADPQHQAVNAAVGRLTAAGDTVVTPFQNCVEFWDVCTRPASARGGMGLSDAEALNRLSSLEATFALLSDDPAVYSHWRSLVMGHGVWGKQVDDARIVALMIFHRATQILTLNPSGFQRYRPAIQVLTC